MSKPLKKHQRHDGALLSAGGRAMQAAGVAIFIAGASAFWLRSRRIQTVIDAQTAQRLSPRRTPANQPVASASDIVIGEPADARPSS